MSDFIPSKSNEGINALANRDSRLGQIKVFDKAIMTHMAISENGYIGIHQPAGKKIVPNFPIAKKVDVVEALTIIHISNVNEFDLVVDNRSGLGGAILGGLIAGGGGMVVGQAISGNKAKSIDLQIKTSDFNNPLIVVPLYRSHMLNSELVGAYINPLKEIAKLVKGEVVITPEQEIQDLLSSLDNIYHAYKNSQATAAVVQTSSGASELAEYKALLDSGVITQEEFDAMKKKILGL